MDRLYSIPFGESLHERLLQECKDDGYGYDEVFFLSADGGLAREGMPFASGGFKRLLADVYVDNIAISAFVQKILIKSQLLECAQIGLLKFFVGLEESDAVCDAVCSFITDLEFAGIYPEDFSIALQNSDSFDEKDKELLTIYMAYRNVLKEEGLYDEADIYVKAAETLRSVEPEKFYKKIIVEGFHNFSYLQMEFIKALKKVCSVDISLCYQQDGVYQAAKKAYEDLAGMGFSLEWPDIASDKAAPLDKMAKSLFSFSADKIAFGESLKLQKYANKRHEMQEVVADIKRKILSGAEPCDILLVMRKIALYHGLQREFAIAGIPASIPVTARLSLLPAADLMLSVLDVAGGFVREGLKKLTGNYIVKKCFFTEAEKVLRVIDEHYFVSLKGAEDKLKNAFTNESNEYRMLEWIFSSLEALPERATVPDMNRWLASICQNMNIHNVLGAMYKENAITADELKMLVCGYEEAMDCLEKMTGEYNIAGEADKIVLLRRYTDVVTDMFSAKTVVLSDGRADGVKVAQADEYIGKRYDHVYVIGLKEGEFPFFESENWLYDDAKRSQLAQIGFIAPSTESVYEDEYFFMSAVCKAKSELWLSVALADNEVVSSYFDEVRILTDRELCVERPVGDVLPGKDFIAYKEILACFLLDREIDSEWLGGYLGEGFFRRAESELPQRESLYMGLLNGSLVMPKMRDCLSGAYSPTSLELYAFCPFRFLLERVWKPDGWDVATDDLRADFKGSFYHECLKRFLQSHKGTLLSEKDVTALSDELIGSFEKLKKEYIEGGKIFESVLTEQLFAEMKEYLSVWLQKEIYYQNLDGGRFCPAELEFSFYELRFEGKEAPALVRGRVDRIDTDGEDYLVTDYKSKGVPKKKDITEGLDLQMPIYALAVEKAFKAPLGGEYFSVENAKREGGFKITPEQSWEDMKENFTETITNVTDGIYRGEFPPYPKRTCPSYCPGIGICRTQVSIQRGLENE